MTGVYNNNCNNYLLVFKSRYVAPYIHYKHYYKVLIRCLVQNPGMAIHLAKSIICHLSVNISYNSCQTAKNGQILDFKVAMESSN